MFVILKKMFIVLLSSIVNASVFPQVIKNARFNLPLLTSDEAC